MDAAASGGFARRAKRSQRTAKSCGPGAATVASILREDIPQTTVTKNAAHRGEHEVSRKAIAWGKPGCLGCTCSPCPCASAHGMPVCSGARDLRAQSAPGFPCALSSREGQRDCKTRAKTRRGNGDVYVTTSFRGDAKHRTRDLEIPGLVLRTIPE